MPPLAESAHTPLCEALRWEGRLPYHQALRMARERALGAPVSRLQESYGLSRSACYRTIQLVKAWKRPIDADQAVSRLLAKRQLREGCWYWKGKATVDFGYGAMWVDGYRWRVHRLAHHLWNGHLQDLIVLHECDNPKCFNPSHLSLGTRQDNVDDMMSKGRHYAQCG
jgi:hypothetical protein